MIIIIREDQLFSVIDILTKLYDTPKQSTETLVHHFRTIIHNKGSSVVFFNHFQGSISLEKIK